VVTSRRSEVRDPVEVVRDYLARGVTGCLQVEDDRGLWRLYVMQGEILAAHGPEDGATVVRRLLNGDSISPKQADTLVDALSRGESFESLLLSRVPQDLFLDLLVQRFRQNVLDFVCCGTEPAFTAMEAVFVDNIQTGHDSIELLDSMAAVRARILPMRDAAADAVVEPGAGAPVQQVHARLLDLADPRRSVASMLSLSPYEDGVTLLAIVEMLDQGLLRRSEGDGRGDHVEEPDLVVEEDDSSQISVPRGPEHLAALEALLEPEPRLEPDTLHGRGAAHRHDEEATQEVAPSAPDDAQASLLDLNSDLIEPIIEPLPDDRDEAPDLSAFFGASAQQDEGPAAPPSTEQPVAASPSAPPAAEDSDPAVAMAIRRAREIEERRAAAREQLERDDAGVTARPPGFDWEMPVDDDELAFFEDQDGVRGGGKGQFSSQSHLLDVVDLSTEGMAAFERASQLPVDEKPLQHDIIEMAEASAEEAAGAVALSFSGPELDEDDMLRKIGVVNDVLSKVVTAIDATKGRGSGTVSLQLLVDGTPTRFAPLFRGVKVDTDGNMDAARLLRNLRKRPQTEHRRLLNDGMLDLIQRCLSASLEELDEDSVDAMLESIAGYQQRLGL